MNLTVIYDVAMETTWEGIIEWKSYSNFQQTESRKKRWGSSCVMCGLMHTLHVYSPAVCVCIPDVYTFNRLMKEWTKTKTDVSLRNSLKDSVVRVVGVAHGVGPSQQHLERDIWDQSSQLLKSLPWTLWQEAHGHIEGSTYTHAHAQVTGYSSFHLLISSVISNFDLVMNIKKIIF